MGHGQTPVKTQFNTPFPTGDSQFNSDNFRKQFQALYQGDLLPLRPIARETPDMKITVLGSDDANYQRGVYYGNNSERVALASGDSPSMSAPSSNPRIDVVYATPQGDLMVETGAEAASPTIPSIASSGDRIPIAAVYHKTTATAIRDYLEKDSYTGDSYIMADLRPLYVIPRESVSAALNAEVARNTRNIMLNRLRIMENHSLAMEEYVDGWADDFQDATGIVDSTEISGDLVASGDGLRYSRNYTHQGTPNFNVIRAVNTAASGDLFRPGDLTSGLQGYWKCDEASGTRSDSSSNGNNLTDNNTVGSAAYDYWESGENSADFEASNTEYLSITDGSQTGLDMNGTDYSAAAWVKIESATTAQLVSKNEDTDGWGFGIDSLRRLYVAHSNTHYGIGSGQQLVLGRWYHVAVVFDDTANTVTFYVNGNVDKIIASATASITNNTGAFHIGRGRTTHYWDGLVKDVGVWNRKLTDLEVKSLALGIDLSESAFRPDDTATAPVMYCKLTEKSTRAGAVTRTDSSGNGNDLVDVSGSYVGTVGGFIEGAAAEFVGNPHGSVMDYLKIDVGDQTNLDFDGAEQSCSVSVWFYATQLDSTDVILHRDTGGNGIHLEVNSTGAVQWRVQRSSTSTNCTAAAGTIQTGVWHHICATYDASDNTMYLYVDGEEVQTASHSAGVGDANTTLYLGTNGTASGSDYLSGYLCDFAIWDVALSLSDIQKLAKGFDFQQQALVSYFKLGEASGDRADSKGSNTLTDNNTVTSETGKVGDGASFVRGNTEYLSITDAAQTDLEFDRYFSIVQWAKPTAALSGHFTLLEKQDPFSTSDGIKWYYEDTPDVKLRLNGTSVGTGVSPNGTNSWDHLCGLYNGGEIKIYMDAKEQANTGHTTDAVANSRAVEIGRSDDSNTNTNFTGAMDEMLIFKRAVMPEEVVAIRNRGLIGDEATSTVGTSSESGNDNKGVVVGGKMAMDLKADKATIMLVSKTGQGVEAEISRNSGDDWNPVDLTLDFYDGTYYYRSGENSALTGDYAAGTGDYYVTFVTPSGDDSTLEAYAVSLA